jgi:hypothetical protein
MAISVMVGYIFVLIYFFLEVLAVKSLSSAVSSRFGGSEQALADNAGFCALCLAALVPTWEQSTSAANVTL